MYLLFLHTKSIARSAKSNRNVPAVLFCRPAGPVARPHDPVADNTKGANKSHLEIKILS